MLVRDDNRWIMVSTCCMHTSSTQLSPQRYMYALVLLTWCLDFLCVPIPPGSKRLFFLQCKESGHKAKKWDGSAAARTVGLQGALSGIAAGFCFRKDMVPV